MKVTMNNILAVLTLALAVGPVAYAQKKDCRSVGGTLLTNLGAVDQNTTMGPATGDLAGAVGATIVSFQPQNNGAVILFAVQHHWVTNSGDTLSFQQATVLTKQVAPNVYGVADYKAHLNGGTGQFAGANGDLKFIGEVDLNTGQLVLRYTGNICYPDND
jgi:hypothetical protein